MKLSDIRGEKSLDIMADVLELADELMTDDGAKALIEGVRSSGGDSDGSLRAVTKYAPALLREDRYRRPIVSILASIAGVEYEEYAESGNILGDIVELLTQDDDLLGFLEQ